MDFDIRKNKPKLIDDNVLSQVILNRKNKIEIQNEPNMIDKITIKIKNSICTIVEDNIFYIIFIIIIILLLIYRYFQYKSIKDNQPPQATQPTQLKQYIPTRKPKEIKYSNSEDEYEDEDEIISDKKQEPIINPVEQPNNNMYASHNSNNLDHFEQW